MRLDRIKINTLLLQSDAKQKVLAEKTGLSRNTINAVCGGKSCREETARKIAEALSVGLSEIQERR